MNIYSLHALRIVVSIIFITHGIQRSIIYKTVPQFGEFLESNGLVAGLYLAWAITVFELAGGLSMAINKWTKYISPAFIIHQIMGITLVHAKNGWFVVGAGTGGMEYSVVLIAALAVLFSHAYQK